MAKVGRYKIPREFKDEDKWFKFFTKEQLLYLFVFSALAAGSVLLFEKIRLTLIGIILALLFIVAGLILPRVDVPLDKYLWGGGIPLKKIVLRIIVKQLPWNKNVYISNVEEEVKRK